MRRVRNKKYETSAVLLRPLMLVIGSVVLTRMKIRSKFRERYIRVGQREGLLYGLSSTWQTRRQLLKKKTPWSESASELYRPSDRRFSAK
jgi:hypothetical protein